MAATKLTGKIPQAFSGKTAIITGASSGLGKALALELAQLGAKLVLASRDEAALSAVSAECEAAGSVAPLIVQTDITRIEDCKRMINETVARFGALDYLILNAGVSMWARFADITDLGIFSRLMETNYMGSVNCVHSAMPHLTAGAGMIVAISSLQGKVGLPLHTGYTASKHALQGFLDALATEQEEVHILTVMPSWIKGTNLRSNAYGPDGQLLGASKRAHSSDAVELEVASRMIVKAMAGRKSELIIPGKMKLLLWLQMIAPGFTRRLIARRVKVQDDAAENQV